MNRRAAALSLVLLGCRKPAPAAVHTAPPPVSAGLLAGTAAPPSENVGKTMLTSGALSLAVEATAQTLPSCLTGLRVTTVSPADCDVTIAPFTIGPAGVDSIAISLHFVCGGRKSDVQTSLGVVCDAKHEPIVAPMAGVMVVTREKATKPLLPPLTPGDRATLEQPITFAKKSAALTPAMDVLVVAKSKILETQPGFAYWLTGTADEFPSVSANRVLSEQRSAAVMQILEGRIADKKRLNRFSVGNQLNRGAGVFFEIRVPE